MKQILVIEDERVMRENLVMMLEFENFSVRSAPDGAQGIALAGETLPDLILCDVTMPNLDGHGVLKSLRNSEETAHIPFIFLTARGEPTDVRIGMNSGADDYLVKPVAKDDLLEAIETRLDRQRLLELKAEFRPSFQSPQPLECLGLSPREAEVLLWLAQGKGNADIAIILTMSEATVKKHLANLLAKLRVTTRFDAALRALETLPQAQPTL